MSKGCLFLAEMYKRKTVLLNPTKVSFTAEYKKTSSKCSGKKGQTGSVQFKKRKATTRRMVLKADQQPAVEQEAKTCNFLEET